MFMEFAIWGVAAGAGYQVAWPVEDEREADRLGLCYGAAGLHLCSTGLGLSGRQVVQHRVDHAGIARRWGCAVGCCGKADEVPGMFLAMLAYAVCYTATLPLVNKLVFEQLPLDAAKVFLWARWAGAWPDTC